ncbi:hypothetical protein [Clostridium akagii]|uniref:hypothetical protein n=1 Tax=Clostridium akagii TaxID=91623 RepID=UPI00047DC252|nr:hypothetical protein [Clostridium akagii]
MDRREFNLENIKYWAKNPIEMIKGQSKIATKEKVPNWTVLIMYVYSIISYSIYLYTIRFVKSSKIGDNQESLIIQIGVILFFSAMTYGFFGVIASTLIRIGVINTDKKTILNRIKNSITMLVILFGSVSSLTGQKVLVEICIVLVIVINIMFLIIDNILKKK